jgi:3',5'-cyclic AMP phosphodiesterase CpdA
MTDTHVIGPQYTTPSENSPNDNASILHTPDRLRAARDRVNAMRPRPDAVFVLGDVTHAAHHSADLAWYEANRNAFTVAREIFRTFEMPVHVLMGNHDYENGCDGSGYPRELSEELFRRFFGAPKYYAVEYGGYRFYLLNGQQGRTWQQGHADCGNGQASFGPEQLRWLDGQLADGRPSVVMSHYMGILWAADEAVDDPARRDLRAVMRNRRNAQMYLGGHTHRWLDFSAVFGHQHYVVGPLRYDDDNFWVLDLDGDRQSITIVDRAKAIWSSTCARTWSYDGAAAEVPNVPERGDCVSGAE